MKKGTQYTGDVIVAARSPSVAMFLSINGWLPTSRTQRFNCHINVEACMTIRAVKYLYKYVYKGHDEAMMRIRLYDDHHNEIDTYIAGRYVAALEAFWHIHSFPM